MRAGYVLRAGHVDSPSVGREAELEFPAPEDEWP